MQVPAPFDYAARVERRRGDRAARAARPGGAAVAGGHSLLPMMKLRLATPEHLIDINPLADELGYIREDGGEVRIGALTRHRELLDSELLADALPDLRATPSA